MSAETQEKLASACGGLKRNHLIRNEASIEANNVIVLVEPNRWVVERAFVDHYASHLSEAMKLAGTWPHKDRDGKPDGFRVGLPRCSVLRQGGLKSGDVIHDINGIRINTMLGAIAAWFDLRDDAHVTVNLVRGGKQVSLNYKIESKRRK